MLNEKYTEVSFEDHLFCYFKEIREFHFMLAISKICLRVRFSSGRKVYNKFSSFVAFLGFP